MFNNNRIEKLETKVISAEYTLHKLTRNLGLLLDYLGLELTRDSIVDGLRLAPKKPKEATSCEKSSLADLDLSELGNAIIQAYLKAKEKERRQRATGREEKT